MIPCGTDGTLCGEFLWVSTDELYTRKHETEFLSRMYKDAGWIAKAAQLRIVVVVAGKSPL
jgi:hypothetical protein